MNEILKVMRERRSIRKYKSEMPTDELIAPVLEAGLWAANGKGLQNTKFIVVKNAELRATLSRLNAQVGGWKPDFDPYYGAPALIAVLDKKGTTHAFQDGCVALSNMMLAAHSVGLGTCWINRAREVFELEEGRKILETLGLNPDEWIGVGNLALGYPDGEPRSAAPRHTDRIITVE